MPKLKVDSLEIDTLLDGTKQIEGCMIGVKMMRALRWSRISLLAAGAIASSLAAQVKPADPSWQMDREVEARRIMHDFAICLSRYSGRGVEEFLATFPGTNEAIESAGRIVTADCLRHGRLQFENSLLRGSLYEIMFEKDFGDEDGVDFSSTPAIDYTQGRLLESDAERMQVGLRQFADCVVRAEPVASRALILSDPADEDESESFAALNPHFRACLSAGAELAFSKPVLRSLIAESLYRLSAAAKAMEMPE